MAVSISNPGGAIAGQNASGNVATYSSVNIGTAAADRIVAICVGTELTNSGPTACTIDFGGGDVAMTAGSLGTQGDVNARIFYLRVPTGTSATVKVTYGATNPTADQARIGALRIVGADLRLFSQGQVADTDADPITTGAVTVPTNGGKLVSYAAAATTARTWTGVTEDLDVNATNFRFSTGFGTTGGSITTTVSGGNAEDAALSYIVLMESPTPVLPWTRDPPAVFTKSVLPVAVVAAGLIWSGFTPPPPTGDGSVEFAQTETIVPYERTLLYPSLQEPPLQNLAELITLDKWFRPLDEPTRWRGLLPAHQQHIIPDPFPRTVVDEYRWHRPLAEPTRRIPTVYPPSALNDPFPRTVVDEYRWHRPLAEPTRRIPTVYPQSELNDPFPRIKIDWFRPLDEPTRRKPTVYPQSALNDPFPRITIAWHVPLSEPTRWRGLLPAQQQAVVPDPFPRPVVDEYRWHRPLSEPVRIQPRPMPELVYSNWVEQQELVTLDKWYVAWREPTRRKVDLSSHQYSAFNPQPFTVADYAWYRPLSEPTRRLPTVYPQSALSDPFPRVSISWYVPLSLPTLRKPTVFPQSALPDPYPFTVADYAWFRPLSEPTRRKPTVHPPAAVPDPFPRTVEQYAWFRPLSEPVRAKPRQLFPHLFDSYYPVEVVVEEVTLDKWWRDFVSPVRAKVLLAYPDALSWGVFTPEPVVEPEQPDEGSNVWQRRPRRTLSISVCKPETDYCVRLRVTAATTLKLPDALPTPPATISVRIKYDGLLFARLQTSVDWPEEDRLAINFLSTLVANEATKPSADYRARFKLAVETDGDYPVAAFFGALDDLGAIKGNDYRIHITLKLEDDDDVAPLPDWLNAD